MDKLWIHSAIVAASLWSSPAVARGPSFVAVARASAGQPELRATFDPLALRLTLCAVSGCANPATEVIALPSEALTGRPQGSLEVIELSPTRRVIHAQVPLDAASGRAWEALVAAPVDGSSAVKVLWSGLTGLVEGEIGERRGPMISVKGHSVLIGDQREDISICGRETILAPRALVPKDLSLKPAKVQRLSAEERAKAVRLVAQRDEAAAPGGSPLRAIAASSAVGAPQALTDGNPATFWGENRGGDGRGEFIVLRTPRQLPLTSLRWVAHPGAIKDVPAAGAAAKEFWLATDDQLFQVSVPQDTWQTAAPAFRIDLPAPVSSECVALVLEQGYHDTPETQVTFSELWARTQLSQDWAELVSMLGGEAQKAQAAAEALRFGGEPAFEAAAAGFSALGRDGQLLALEVLDQGPCSSAAPAYFAALQGGLEDTAKRLSRCSREVAGLMVTHLEQTQGAARKPLLLQLAEIAPQVAAERMPRWLQGASANERARLRGALDALADAADAEGFLRAALKEGALSDAAQLDLLRALSRRARELSPEYQHAVERQAKSEKGFAEQYLLLQPTAALAALSPFAREHLRGQLKGAPRAELRAEAARRADRKLFEKDLIAATQDGEMRVRHAAVESLSQADSLGRAELRQLGPAATGALVERLTIDAWPLVRAAAARALIVAPANPKVDAALAQALSDESRHVRRPAVYSLGRRRAVSELPAVRETLRNEEEDPAVRAAAAVALGVMCDRGSQDVLTGYAQRLHAIALNEAELWIGRAALQALADLKPKDLQRRLAPLLGKNAPKASHRLAREALAKPGKCSNAAQGRVTKAK